MIKRQTSHTETETGTETEAHTKTEAARAQQRRGGAPAGDGKALLHSVKHGDVLPVRLRCAQHPGKGGARCFHFLQPQALDDGSGARAHRRHVLGQLAQRCRVLCNGLWRKGATGGEGQHRLLQEPAPLRYACTKPTHRPEGCEQPTRHYC